LDEYYSTYFGLDETETKQLLESCNLSLNDDVKRQYNGYLFNKIEMYNPWALLSYAKRKQFEDYWINTSSNTLVHKSIAEAGNRFQESFDKLIVDETVNVVADLTCSFIELKRPETLWGLLINTGYLTVLEQTDESSMTLRIPNGEVKSEFVIIVANKMNLQSQDLIDMFQCLLDKDLEGFMNIYRELVLACTSYHDAKENAYHMLFLGMSFILRDIYTIKSNIESGYGRSDITMESRFSTERPHIVIEFKQGEDIEKLKQDALMQITDKKYYTGLKGEVLCIGMAHNIKECDYAYKSITV
jgi:hypothetical protein